MSIKAEELRIGNWIDATNASKIFTNHGDNKFTEYSRATYVRVSDISDSRVLAGGFHCKDSGEPIPLTPEILEKAGFKYAADDDVLEECKLSAFEEVWWISGMYFIEKGWQGYTFYKSTDEDTYMQLVVIEHLHQLQNLYYALTNTELNIEL
jgi:hypothetical protein